MTEYSFRFYGNFPHIYLPKVTGAGDYGAGYGIVVEVYEKVVLIKGRNFITGEWIENLFYHYHLK
jgi:hypothetical protein